MCENKPNSKAGENRTPIVRDVPLACADEDAAVAFMERLRWGDCPCCPECGSVDVYQMQAKTGEREANYRWRCRDCKRRYTVRTGTVMEQTRIPLRCWCHAFWRACSSKKGVSAKQIQRETGVSYKTALFLLHRVRFAMADMDGVKLSGTVEADETYVGGKPRHKGWKKGRECQPREKWSSKTPVFAMVERGGRVKAEVMQSVTAHNLRESLVRNVDSASRLMTDDASKYERASGEFASHDRINHTLGEYVRGDVTTNGVESFFAILKRGVYGTYHAVSKAHLHRYVDEFAFRYNTRKMDDGERVQRAIDGAIGRRLMYRRPENLTA